MLVIGLVGPPAGGKSTVARTLVDLGAAWLDADRLAHQVLRQPETVAKLEKFFGSDLLIDGQVDRKWLANQVFGTDPDSRHKLHYLESSVHPPTRQLLQQRLIEAKNRNAPAAVLDVPLLFESGWDVYCDEIWCLNAPVEQRSRWIGQRGWSPEMLQQREARQLPLNEKMRLSSRTIPNSNGLQDLIQNVQKLWCQLEARSPEDGLGPSHC